MSFLLEGNAAFIIRKCTHIGIKNNNAYQNSIKGVPSTKDNNFNKTKSITTVTIAFLHNTKHQLKKFFINSIPELYHKKFENDIKMTFSKNTTFELLKTLETKQKTTKKDGLNFLVVLGWRFSN